MIINIRRLVVSALLVSGITSAFSQTSDAIEGCVPLSVNFSAPTNLSYYWDFKDGSTSTLQNPNNIFSIAGTYQVSLKESVNGNEIGTKTIKVYAAPELKLNTSNTKGCPSFLATIESESIIDPAISINSYSWGFGNGLSRITSTNSVSNTYNTLGKFDVTLSIN